MACNHDGSSEVGAPPRPFVRALAAVLTATLVVGISLATSHAASAANAEDWPTFGHDNIHTGVSADTAVGATAAPGLALKWKTSVIGGKVEASPAVVYNSTLNKKLAYTASTTSTATIDAIDVDTGAIVWSFAPGAGIASSPSVYANTVYFGAGNHLLYALDATTGAVQCTSFDTGGGIAASPVVADLDGTGPVVFVGDNGTSEHKNAGHEWAIYGVGGQNAQCTEKWMFNGWANKGPKGNKAGSWSSPALATDITGRPLLVFGSSNPDNAVYALNARDGSQVWRFQTLQTGGDQDVGAAPTVGVAGSNGIMGDGLVYVDGKDKIEYALDMFTGSKVWEFSMVDNAGTCTNKDGTAGPCKFNSVSSTVLVNGMVVVNYWTYTFALNATTGAVQWRSPARSDPGLSSPAVSGGSDDQVVFTGDLGGTAYAYNLSDGSQLFSYATNPGSTGVKILSTPVIAYGKILVAANTTLYALG